MHRTHRTISRSLVAVLAMASRIFLLLALSAGVSLSAAQTTIIYGHNTANDHLVTFSPTAPQTLLSDIALIGLNANEALVGIDFRPATGELYGLAVARFASRLVKINTSTGILSTVTPGPTPVLNFQLQYDISFNPVVDRIRVISSANGNIRLHPDNDTLAGTDSAPAYVAGDVHAGVTPMLGQLAYTNSNVGATITTAFAIDSGTAKLVRFGGPDGSPSPNGGALTTVGPLGITPSSMRGGFDIRAGSNAAFAMLTTPSGSNLYSINLMTGAATLLGAVGSNLPIDSIATTSPLDPCLDVDGDGAVNSLTDGLLVVRALLGLTGTSVTDNALPTPAPPRATWSAIRTYMNANCGMNFGP